MNKAEIDRRVHEAARLLGLEPISTASRGALGRPAAARRDGARDRARAGRVPDGRAALEPRREAARADARRDQEAQDDLGTTTIYVTHDQVEAMTMGDRVAVMRKGELQQVAEPQELYDRPVNLFVGGFIGSPAMNLVEAKLERATAARAAGRRPAVALGDETLSARPGLKSLRGPRRDPRHPPGGPRGRAPRARHPGEQTLEGEVELTEALGSEVMVHFSIDATPAITDEVRELQEDAGHRGHRHARAGGGRPHDHGRPLRRPLEGEQGRPRPRRSRHACFALLRSGNGSRHLRRKRKRGSKRMTKRRFILLALLVACSRSSPPAVAATTTRPRTPGARPPRRGGEAVSGNISVLAVWTGAEGEAFQAVLDGLQRKPDVTVSYKSASEPATVLSTAVEGGNPPDIAAPAARLHDRLRRARRVEADRVRPRSDRGGLLRLWLDLGTVDGRSSTASSSRAPTSRRSGTTSPPSRTRASSLGRLGRVHRGRRHAQASGVTPYSIGAADGWTLTDLFENIYPHRGRDKYDQLTKHEIPWTDESARRR